MDKNKIIEHIEKSFLKELLADENVTDISFNGKDIFYVHNKLGRLKSKIIINDNEPYNFIKQIANLCEKFFSISDPILDVSIGRYRINAVHYDIARIQDEKCINFSIRIISSVNRVENDNKFMNKKIKNFLVNLIKNKQSIVIAGPPGSGKTELQKFLISKMEDNSRAIIIDNLLELENIKSNEHLDISTWQFDENSSHKSINSLIKNALRSNPDWLIVAESRGKEMNQILNSILTGIPIITTLHSKNIDTIIERMISMIKLDDKTRKEMDIKNDIISHVHFYIYVDKRIKNNGEVIRFISNILFINSLEQSFSIYDKKICKNIYLNDEINKIIKGEL